MFEKDSIATGFILGLGTITLLTAAIYVIFAMIGMSIEGNMRFFLLAFVPCIILIRYYLRKLYYHKTGYTLIIIVFVLMILFFVYLFRARELVL